jgi:DNA-binding CsgD family transcriptional regulator/tetratricopeptide (TPR) repeat protein
VERAPHVARVAVSGDRASVAVLTAAADEVEGTRPHQAVQWRRAALALLPAQDGGRVGLLVALGRACGPAGLVSEGGDALTAALRTAPLSTVGRADWIRLIGDLGRPREAAALIRQELPLTREPFDRAALSLDLAGFELTEGEVDAARQNAARARDLADEHGLRALACAARGLLALATRPAEAELSPLLDGVRLSRLLDDVRDDDLRTRPDAPLWVGRAELALERPRDALRQLDRAVLLCRSAGWRRAECHALVERVAALCACDRLSMAGESADEALHVAEASGSEELLGYAAAALCLVAAREMNLDLLRRRLAAAGTPAEHGTLAVQMLAEATLAAGDPEGCLTLLEAHPRQAARRYELLVRACLAAGRTDTAARWAAEARAFAGRSRLNAYAALALLAHARVTATRDPVAGTRIALDAAEALDAAGLTWDAAMARNVSVRGRSRRQATSGAPALTERERQIVELVGDGLKNREIADRLYVTPKTVEMHLSRIFTKLGVSNRVGVARTLYAEAR